MTATLRSGAIELSHPSEPRRGKSPGPCIEAGCTRGRYADSPVCKTHRDLLHFRHATRDALHGPFRGRLSDSVVT